MYEEIKISTKKEKEKMNKKAILVISMILLSFAFVSAASLEFNESDGDYGSYDVDTWIPNFLGGDGLSEVKLIENSDSCLVNCYSILEFNNEKPVNLLEDISFIGKTGSDASEKILNLKFTYGVYQDVEYSREVLEEVCINKEYQSNSTTYTECINEVIGTETYSQSEMVWNDYDGEKIEGQVYLRIDGNKIPTKDIDWIITFRGEELTKYAWWDSDWSYKREINSLNGSISALYNISYYTHMNANFSDLMFLDYATEVTELDYVIISKTDSVNAMVRVNNLDQSQIMMYYGNSAASSASNATAVYNNPVAGYFFANNSATDFTENSYDGTITGASFTTNGKFDGAFDFSAGTDKIDLGDIEEYSTSNRLTLSAWINADTIVGVDTILAQKQLSATRAFVFDLSTGTPRSILWDSTGGAAVLTTATTVSTGTWYFMAMTYDGSNARLYLDGQLLDTQPLSPPLRNAPESVWIGKNEQSAGEEFDGRIDEVRIFDKALSLSELHALGNETMPSFAVGAEELLSGININLISPSSNEKLITKNINFTYNITVTGGDFANTTMFIYNSTTDALLITNYSELSGNFSRIINWTNNLNEGGYKWYAEVCEENGACANSSNLSFSIDTTLPTIDIINPKGTLQTILVGHNETLNYSISDLNIDSCWYEYNYSNTTLNCSGSTTLFEYVEDVNNITLYANDTFGNTNYSSELWEYLFVDKGVIYDNVTLEGSSESFEFSFSKGSSRQVSKVDFVYENITSSATVTKNNNDINATITYVIPNVDSATNNTFYFSVLYDDATIYNSTTNTQLVNIIDVDNCGTYNNTIFNLTILDEETQDNFTLVNSENSTIELDVVFKAYETSSIILQSSDLYENINPALICLNTDLNGAKYSVEVVSRYYGNSHAIEYYNIQDFTVENASVPKNIILYDLLATDSTEFQVSFRDNNGLFVDDAVILFNRQYVSEGVFKTVEAPKTDGNGQTVAHLDEKDVVYNIVVQKNGLVLATFNNIIPFCEDSASGLCVINLIQTETDTEFFSYDEEFKISYVADFEEVEKIITFDFTTKDSTSKNVSIVVEKIDMLGGAIVGSESLTTASGTITIDLPQTVGNSTFIASVFVDGEIMEKFVVDGTDKNPYGIYGFFVFFILFITLLLMLSSSKTMIIIGAILGFIAALWLSIVSVTSNGTSGILGSIIWLVIGGGILLYKLNKGQGSN